MHKEHVTEMVAGAVQIMLVPVIVLPALLGLFTLLGFDRAVQMVRELVPPLLLLAPINVLAYFGLSCSLLARSRAVQIIAFALAILSLATGFGLVWHLWCS